MTLDHVPILLELLAVEGDKLVRRVVGLIFLCNYFQTQIRARDLNVGTLLVLCILLCTCSRIDGKPKISGINSFADMNSADRRVDVDTLVLLVRILLDIDLACGQQTENRHRKN